MFLTSAEVTVQQPRDSRVLASYSSYNETPTLLALSKDAPLQRPERLPFEAVRRERIAVSLADGLGEQALAPILVVALRAGQIHLTVPRMEERAPAVERRFRRTIDRDRERHAARLAGNVRSESEQIVGFARPGRQPLPLHAAGIDALLAVAQTRRQARGEGPYRITAIFPRAIWPLSQVAI